MSLFGDDNSISNDGLGNFSDGFSSIFKENYLGEFHGFKLSFEDEIENENENKIFKLNDKEKELFQYIKEGFYFDIEEIKPSIFKSSAYSYSPRKERYLKALINLINKCFNSLQSHYNSLKSGDNSLQSGDNSWQSGELSLAGIKNFLKTLENNIVFLKSVENDIIFYDIFKESPPPSIKNIINFLNSYPLLDIFEYTYVFLNIDFENNKDGFPSRIINSTFAVALYSLVRLAINMVSFYPTFPLGKLEFKLIDFFYICRSPNNPLIKSYLENVNFSLKEPILYKDNIKSFNKVKILFITKKNYNFVKKKRKRFIIQLKNIF